MIDWGDSPSGSVASIYWPQVDDPGRDGVAEAQQHAPSLGRDINTVQCKVTEGVTYIPIPTGSGQNFAGLFTVDVPPTVINGQVFDVVVGGSRRAEIAM